MWKLKIYTQTGASTVVSEPENGLQATEAEVAQSNQNFTLAQASAPDKPPALPTLMSLLPETEVWDDLSIQTQLEADQKYIKDIHLNFLAALVQRRVLVNDVS